MCGVALVLLALLVVGARHAQLPGVDCSNGVAQFAGISFHWPLLQCLQCVWVICLVMPVGILNFPCGAGLLLWVTPSVLLTRPLPRRERVCLQLVRGLVAAGALSAYAVWLAGCTHFGVSPLASARQVLGMIADGHPHFDNIGLLAFWGLMAPAHGVNVLVLLSRTGISETKKMR